MSHVGLSTTVGALVGLILGVLLLWLAITGGVLEGIQAVIDPLRFYNSVNQMRSALSDAQISTRGIVLLLFAILGAFIGFANEIGKR